MLQTGSNTSKIPNFRALLANKIGIPIGRLPASYNGASPLGVQ